MYTDEYFQIEQMNNQLINSQRALMKSNQKLQSLLAEIRQASNAIAILEQDDLTALYSASAFYRRVEKCIQEHPDLGFIPPNQFIPLIEKEGLIYEVDKYIWEEACRILKERRDLGLRSLPISVNVARGDLYEKDLCVVFDQLLQKYDLPGNLLHLEIIERASVNDTDNITHILNTLREDGFLSKWMISVPESLRFPWLLKCLSIF